MDVGEQSDRLHARVRAFMRASLEGDSRESFDNLALSIARFQAARVPALARLVAARGVDLYAARRAGDIPAVPTDVFRMARVAAHPSSADARLFRTSGTSQGAAARGEHPLRTTATYELGALLWGRRMLFPDRARMGVIVLAPPAHEAVDSSLGFMMDLFASALGGSASFAVRGGALDAELVERACQGARASGDPVVVLGASFAFVHLLDSSEDFLYSLPPGSRAMQTGGFKGRSREVDPPLLRRRIAAALGIPEAHVVGEYGMTELSSQAYEATLAAALGALPERRWQDHARPGVYFAPPWMRVTPVDPESLLPVPPGEVGIARIEDLANVDSAVAVQTSDLVRAEGDGVELLGRAPGAIPRGCSIAIDEVLGGVSEG
jgi:acyl-CoA synthetase (AMP-forming)/AMP-acid ligase II